MTKSARSRKARRAEWEAMVLRAMNKDFSWGASAKQYMDLYTELLK